MRRFGAGLAGKQPPADGVCIQGFQFRRSFMTSVSRLASILVLTGAGA